MKKSYFHLLISSSLCLFLVISSFAQDRAVTGTVKADGETLPGVNILLQGTSVGTVTDVDGKYSITVSGDNPMLTFSSIGYVSETIAVGNRSVIDVSLVADITQLSEVVVTALGVEREVKSLNYSVTNVAGDNFTEARENNIANQLSGRIAGVNVSKTAGGPAGSTRVLIRGNKTLSGGAQNQPLYVIDGVPMDNSNFGQAGIWGGYDEGDGLTSINPDDIESITVLKGANAAALFGARGGNGVINIVTKRGRNRKGIGVTLSSNYVFETVNNLSELQHEYGSGVYVNGVPTAPSTQQQAYDWGDDSWGPRMDGSSVIQFDGVSRPYSDQGDNWKRYYETANSITNSIALSGGNENQTFRFSVADLRSDGVIPNSGFDRTNVTLSTSGKFGDKITVEAKVLYSHEYAKNRPRLTDSPANAIQSIWRMPPSLNVDNYLGDPNKLGAIPADATDQTLAIQGKVVGEEYQQASNNWGQNPWWAAYQHINDDTRDRIITSGRIRYDVTDFLYVQGRIGMDFFTRRSTDLTPQGVGYQRGGAISEGVNRIREINMEWMLGFDKTFDKISINAFVGGNNMNRLGENISANGNNFNVPFFAAINNAVDRNFGFGYSEQSINSIFGSAEIGYNGILFITATARKDWFSVLNPEFNDILYPSVGASFVFSDAINTLPSWLSFGKVRASWAQVGFASGVNPYAVNLTYSLNGNSHLGHTMASFSSNSIPNPTLQPALSTELEFGIDARFFNNRVGIDLTYYSQKTTDDILPATISRASGFQSTFVNVGELQNKGIEILVNGTPLQGDLTWDVSVNFAKNKNEVVSLIEGNDELVFEESRTRTTFIKHIIGYPYGMITGWKQKTSPSGELVYDAEGQPVRSDAYEILGNGIADWTGGVNNSITYKGINLSFLIDVRVGGDIHSGSNMRLDSWGVSERSLIGREGDLSVSGVIQTGEDGSGNPIYEPLNMTLDADQARNYWNNLGNNAGENYIYDAGFAKLRQLTLGYSLPSSILDRTPFNNVTLSFVARNLAILWKNTPNIDPESNYSTNGGAQGLEYFAHPATRSFGFNLKVGL